MSDEIELLALWRLVAEAKFQRDPDDRDLWGSPYVHRLSCNISDSLLKAYELKGDAEAAARHRAWLESLPENIVLPIIKANLKRDAREGWWQSQSLSQKVAHVERCISPFKATAQFIEELVRKAEADNKLERS